MAEGMPGGRGGNERREGQIEGRAFFSSSSSYYFVFFPCVLGLRLFCSYTTRERGTSRGFFSVGTLCRVPVIAGAFFSRSTNNYYIALATWDAVLFSFRFYLVIMRLHGKAILFGNSAWQRLHHDMVESFLVMDGSTFYLRYLACEIRALLLYLAASRNVQDFLSFCHVCVVSVCC